MRRIFLWFTLVWLGLWLMSCNATKPMARSADDAFAYQKLSSPSDLQAQPQIIYQAFLDMIFRQPDTANARITQVAQKYGGYVNQVGTYQTIIRVESQHFEAALTEIEALGKTRSKRVVGRDVTEEFLDLEIRLENAQKARERYLALLEKAENVAAALQVEKELERLNETIDRLQGKLNRMEHLVSYATLTINLQEKKKPGPIGYIGVGLYHAIKWLFVRN